MGMVLQNEVSGIRPETCEALSEGYFGIGVELVPLRIHLPVLVGHQLSDLHQRLKLDGKVLRILVVYQSVRIVHGLLAILQHAFGFYFVFCVFRVIVRGTHLARLHQVLRTWLGDGL